MPPGDSLSATIKHHFATAIAFAFLVIWYYGLQAAGFLDYMTELMPDEYQGSGLMLAIGFGMTPAFFIWSRFNRWAEKKLNITGRYYEDGFYKDKDSK